MQGCIVMYKRALKRVFPRPFRDVVETLRSYPWKRTLNAHWLPIRECFFRRTIALHVSKIVHIIVMYIISRHHYRFICRYWSAS